MAGSSVPDKSANTDGYYDPVSRLMTSVPVPNYDENPAYGNGGKGKIDEKKLFELIKEGRSQAYMSRYFGCSPAAITQKINKLQKAVITEVAPVAGHIVAREIRTIDQLCKINRTANALLDSLEVEVETSELDPITGETQVKKTKTIDRPDIALKAMAEIRSQLKFQMEIFQALTDVRAVKEFQDTVLEVIGQVDPALRDKVVQALVGKNALRSALEYHR